MAVFDSIGSGVGRFGRAARQALAAPGRAHRHDGGRASSKSADVDVPKLAAKLSSAIEGEVRFDEGSRGLYTVDASNYRQVPIGVVVPRTIEDVVQTVRICRELDAPVLSRGGGTSLAGQCCNVAVVIDWSKHLNKVLEIDEHRRIARVQPGVILDDLRHQTRRVGLTFGPDPATHTHCTIGGMLGNNSCGVHAQMAGRTVDNVHALEVLTYAGQRLRVGPTSDDELEAKIRAGGAEGLLYARMKALRNHYVDLIRDRYVPIPRRVSGYNLDELLPEKGFNVARALVGSESTLVTILEAELCLVPEPRYRAVVVLGYPDVYRAADHITDVLRFAPIGLEAVDAKLVSYMQMKNEKVEHLSLFPEGKGWLIAEFGGDSHEQAVARGQAMIDALRGAEEPPTMKLFDDEAHASQVWEVRESGLGATARAPQGEKTIATWPGWEDASVAPEKLGSYLREFQKLMERHGYDAALYGHFGQGCVHCRLDFDLKSPEGIRKYRMFASEAADLVISFDGSLSGEHGDGQSRAELLPKMYGAKLLRAMQEFKALWDPRNRMNPGKVIEPFAIDENLRFGADYTPATPKTYFQYPEDEYSFVNATERCVGVGKCRRDSGGVMCPSYMVTKEEMHSTRGRAHLLHEMLMGDPVKDGWKSEAVKEALDLCLSCKGCKSDCPVNVDMATYKSEFLAHYYEGRTKPRSAFAFGLIMQWARIGGRIPGLANLVTQTPGLSRIAKWAAGIAPERDIPTFGAPSLQKRVRGRTRPNEGATRVILFPDTFNNWFHPDVGMAGYEVLEAAGFDVEVPQKFTCCGRPLYEYGMIDEARRLLRKLLDDFRDDLRAGTPIVVLEPSCASVFKTELQSLFPHDMDAQRLKAQVFTLAEFLVKKAPGFALPKLDRKALVQGHCHHRSVLDFDADKKVFTRMGLDAEVVQGTCCGMAGSFGFEKDKFRISQEIGEHDLLPAVRDAEDSTVVLTDGFSCKTQIAQNTGREALHTAQWILLGLQQGPLGPEGKPERTWVDNGGRAALARVQKRIAVSSLVLGSVLALRSIQSLRQRAWGARRPRRRSGALLDLGHLLRTNLAS